MTGLTVAVQMDPLAAIDPPTDSTLILMREAARRGHALYHYTPDRLRLEDGMPVARAQPLAMQEEGVAERQRLAPLRRAAPAALEREPYCSLGEPVALPLAGCDVVLMRQDPPFNMAYISATYMLERLRGEALVVNDPAEVRNNPEKLFPLQFPAFMPPTLISASADDIRAFQREQGEIVVKPLYGHGGAGVFRIGRDGANLPALLELLLKRRLPIVAQCFLPEIATEERRVILINGEVSGLYARIPAGGEIRANIHSGGHAEPAKLTSRQREICDAVGPVLKARGMVFAGLDVAGDWLVEINITSPTGFSYLKKFYGLTPERDFWDAVERRL